jgi:pyrroline-5-carboxylate reductase
LHIVLQLAGTTASLLPHSTLVAVLVSVAAGWPIDRLQVAAPGHPIVRLMPNLAVAGGRGVVAMATRGLDVDGEERVRALLAPLGAVVPLDESLFAIATAIGGSGPGFLAYIAAAMERAGVEGGMPRDAARSMVQGVLDGTALLLDGGEDPAALQARVTSPGGTTAAGIAALDERGAGDAVVAAVAAAAARAAEL